MAARFTGRRIRRWFRGKLPLASLIGLSDRDRERLLWHACKALTHHRIDDAAEIYRATLTLWPEDSAAQLGLAACSQLVGNFSAAEAAYNDLISRDAGNLHAIANRAEVRLLTNRPNEAKPDLNALVALPRRALHRAGLIKRLETLHRLADRLKIEVNSTAGTVPCDRP